jgi:hypothetical protein
MVISYRLKPVNRHPQTLLALHRRPCTWHFLFFFQNIRQRPNRRNSKLVDLRMTLGIMLLDMLKLRRILERRPVPVQVTQPLVQVWVSGANIADVALEVLDVDGIEADYGGEETDIGFSGLLGRV